MFVNTALQRCGLTYDSIRNLYDDGKSFNDDTYYKLCFARARDSAAMSILISRAKC
jgi:hypothetical protein